MGSVLIIILVQALCITASIDVLNAMEKPKAGDASNERISEQEDAFEDRWNLKAKLIKHDHRRSTTNEEKTSGHRLIEKLLDSYDARVRPVRNPRIPTNITLRLNLYQVLDVNEPNQNIMLNMWLTQMWTDEFLGWNPHEYEGINSTIVPWQDIWLPDTYLYNSLVMSRDSNERWINVVVSTDGKVGHMRFMYPTIFTFSCKLNIRYFPFDDQNCTMIFGSWTSDSQSIDYFPETEVIGQEDFIQHEEWTVKSFKMYRIEEYFNCCPYPWIHLHAYLIIQRKPLFYLINLIVPTTIITLVAIIGFFTPSSSSGERTEKVNLGITTLLAMAILLLMVSDSMPATSDFIPLIGWFLLGIIIMVSTGTLLSSAVICIHRRGINGEPLPVWLRKILVGAFPKAVHVTVPKGLAKYWCEGGGSNHNNCAGHKQNAKERKTDEMENIHLKEKQEDFKWNLSEQEKAECIELEWEFAANVVDRVLLILFAGSLFLGCSIVLLIGMLRY